MGCVYLIRGQLTGGHLQATEDQFANQGYNITSFYKRLVGTIMQAHHVPTQKGNVAISLPVPSIPWNEQTDGNRTCVARHANRWTDNEKRSMFFDRYYKYSKAKNGLL